MLKRTEDNGLVVQAVAGTNVVYLGWDMPDAARRKGLLGFAIRRTDRTENESYWLRGMKTFPETHPPLPPGGDASLHEQPLQSFQWGDYTAKPGHDYEYQLVPMYGEPFALKEGPAAVVRIQTEAESPDEVHNVFFNRGAVAAQEYARRFQNKPPEQVGEAAYAWLSRGLIEALLAFIGEAKNHTFGLYGAIYEFQWPAVLDALGEAADRGADVKIVFDAIENPDMKPVTPNRTAIKTAKITKLTKPFTDGKLMHNKFIVLTHNGKPVSVWTGSTNVTENGIFGHLNCGHRVNDKGVAGEYLEYWNQLAEDPGSDALRQWTASSTPTPTPKVPPPKGVTVAFSPQSGLSTLNAYAAVAGSAAKGLFMTFAFGMNKAFLQVYQQTDDKVRFALMEKEGNGKGLAQGKKDIAAVRKLTNVYVAIGKNIKVTSFDRWLKEASQITRDVNVHWVHTKFMVVDPFSSDPVVITGSANFSDASTTTNEENMLIIRGDRRVAHIYFTEFMRSFAHYAFREAVYNRAQLGLSTEDWRPQDLDTTDGWLADYFGQHARGAAKRLYFSGQ